MKKIIVLASACVLAGAASAQPTVLLQNSTGRDAVKVLSYTSAKVGDRVNLDFVLNYDNLVLDRNEEFVVMPYITDGADTVKMRPVVFMGENYYRKHSRNNTLHGQKAGEQTPYETVVFSNKEMREKRRELRRSNGLVLTGNSVVNYNSSFPYRAWMNSSDVVLNHQLDGYRGQSYDYDNELGVLLNPVAPKVTFIIPEAEPVKARNANMTAHVTFPLDKTEIRRDLFDNAQELDMIYSFTDNIIGNNDVTITGITLKGYASPEGNFKHNDKLAAGRVEALYNNLASKYNVNVDRSKIDITHVAEDWDSVARWVASSDLRYRNEVVGIIRNTPEPDARDARIRALDNGVTYKIIEDRLYPSLRRVEYAIDYTVIPFTAERGRQVMRTNPEHLSLNEYYLVALSYPETSPQFAEVFEVALRQYPDDPIANHNMAAVAISNGDYAKAKKYMEKCKDMQQAKNNLAIIYLLDGDRATAEQHFRSAMNSGSKDAAFNHQHISSLSLR